MTPAELRKAASAISPLDGKPISHLYLTLHRDRIPRGENVRLAGRSGPFGRLCTIKEAGQGYDVVAVFKAEAIVAFCDMVDWEKQT